MKQYEIAEMEMLTKKEMKLLKNQARLIKSLINYTIRINKILKKKNKNTKL